MTIAEVEHRKKIRTKKDLFAQCQNCKLWVFATSNNVSKVMLPLQSRFFVINLNHILMSSFVILWYDC
jgi:hypothetical protein